jgi:hypothetical protein
MEDKPIFQFKKAKITISGIDPDGPSEWELLVKHDTNDLPSFYHFHKLWIRLETPDEVDADGNVTKPGTRQMPVVQVYRGFIKDDKFVVTGQQSIQANSFHECHKKFKFALESAIKTNGFKKDESRYSGIFGQPQQYYSNERTPMPNLNQSVMGQISQLVSQATQGQPATSGQNPHIQIIPKKKGLANLMNSISNLQQNP